MTHLQTMLAYLQHELDANEHDRNRPTVPDAAYLILSGRRDALENAIQRIQNLIASATENTQ